jgi:hypothetical protein
VENSIKNIYEELNNTLNSFSFIDRYRLSQTAFIRNRTLSFPTLILYLLNLRQHSNQTELDQFFKLINKEKEASQVVTKSAFFQARKQLSYKAFIELNRQIIDTTYKSYDHLKTWRGFRLCAVDGSSIRLPNTPPKYASQIRLTLRHILAFTKGVKSKLIARWEWHQFFMMF